MSVLVKTSVANQFLDCLAHSKHVTQPFDYWLIDGALPEDDIDAIVGLPFAPPSEEGFSGRRETNNSSRTFFSPENQERFPVMRRIAMPSKTSTSSTPSSARHEPTCRTRACASSIARTRPASGSSRTPTSR